MKIFRPCFDFYFILFLSYQDSNNHFGEKDKVRVVVRIRPTSDQEQASGDQEIVSCDRSSLIVSYLDLSC